MKIKKLRIKNFRSIKDSGWWDFTNNYIQILVGRNGSGKSSIIDALIHFNKEFRRINEDDRPLDMPNQTELQIKLEIDEDDIKNNLILEILQSEMNELPNEVEISKIFIYPEEYFYKINEKDIFYFIDKSISKINGIIKKIEMMGFSEYSPIFIKDSLKRDYNEIMKILSHSKEELRKKISSIQEMKRETYNDLINMIHEIIKNIGQFNNEIASIAPAFIKYSYQTLSPFLDEITYNPDNKKKLLVKTIFKAMNLNFSDFIENNGNIHRIKNLSNSRDFELVNYIVENWHQKNVSIEMEFYADKYMCFITENGSSCKVSQRSTGEIWLLTFLIFLYAHHLTEKYSVVLMDEPSANLHPNAQRSVIKTINKFIENNQKLSIIFTTHSPYLIPTEKIEHIVRVLKHGIEGTKIKKMKFQKLCEIKNRRLSKKCNTNTVKARFSQMLSVSVREGFFGIMIVLCEGYTEFLSLPIWAKIIGKNFDKDGIVLIQTNGKFEMIDYAEFFSVFDLPVFLIFDNDKNKEMDKTNKKQHKETNRWLLEFAGGDLEDFPTKSGEKYFVFNPKYEVCLRSSDLQYEKYESEVGPEYGVSKKKGIRARYVTLRYLEDGNEPPEPIIKLIRSIFKLKEKYS